MQEWEMAALGAVGQLLLVWTLCCWQSLFALPLSPDGGAAVSSLPRGFHTVERSSALSRQARQLQGFLTNRAYAHTEAALLFKVETASLTVVGNLSYSQTLSAGFYINDTQQTSTVVSVTNQSWYQSTSFVNTDCATVTMQASGELQVMIIRTQAFSDLYAQLQRGPDNINDSLLQPPNIPEGGLYRQVTDANFTVALERDQAYLLAFFNPNTVPVELMYSLDVSSAEDPGCADYLSDRGVTIAAQPAAQAAALFSYLPAQRTASYMAFTGASCLAYGIAFRSGPNNDGGTTDLSVDILNPNVPRPPSGLNTSLFLMDNTNLTAYGQGQFQQFRNYTTGGLCTITSDTPGPCFAYADGLDPSQTYSVWMIQGPAQDPNVQFWTWHEARALPEGSCASLWPVTPSPPPSPPTGGSATSAQSSSSSNIGAIVGGVVGGCVALALFVLLGVLLWRRRSASTLHDEELIHKSYYTGTSDTYSTGFRSYQGKEVSEGDSAQLQDFRRALSSSKFKASFESSSGSYSQSSKSHSKSGQYTSDADFSEIEQQFGVHGADLPDPSNLPSHGILSIGEDLDDDALSDDSYLEDTWIIKPEDLHCKVVNGKPVLLGSGGFGSVYLGVLNRVREVAVKVVNSRSRKQQHRFIREIKTLKACLDPNIVQFLGASIRGAQILMVMQLMPGGDLWSKLEHDIHGEFRWYRRGRQIALDVAKGLTFLHSKKIAHLDLKTPNILLTDNNEAKISDVGLGKLISGPSVTATQQGSFYWASPEQLLGNPTTVASDMFSMGTVLWEICTGEQPRGRLLREINAPVEAPESIVLLIKRCLAFEPADRPTAVELHDIIMQS